MITGRIKFLKRRLRAFETLIKKKPPEPPKETRLYYAS